jgi:hypothetical protein
MTNYQDEVERVENKTVEEIVELTFDKIIEANEEIEEKGVDHYEVVIKREITNAITTAIKEAEEREAYLWFNNWYSYTHGPITKDSTLNFGKWGTERLQELGATPPTTTDLTN